MSIFDSLLKFFHPNQSQENQTNFQGQASNITSFLTQKPPQEKSTPQPEYSFKDVLSRTINDFKQKQQVFNAPLYEGLNPEQTKKAKEVVSTVDPYVQPAELTQRTSSGLLAKHIANKVAEKQGKEIPYPAVTDELGKEAVKAQESFIGGFAGEAPVPEGFLGKGAKVVAKELTPVTVEKPFSHVESAQTSPYIAQDISNELGGTYKGKSNVQLAENAAARVNEDIQAAKEFALSNSTDEAVATRIELERKLSSDYLKETDPVKRRQIAEEAIDIHKQHAALNVEEGRAVQANALLNARTPDGVVKSLTREIEEYNKVNPKKKVPNLTPDDYDYIIRKMDEIQKIPEETVKKAKQEEFLTGLEKRLPAPIWKQLVTVWKAGLLTGFSTHLVNLVSTISHVGFEGIKDIPASGVDALVSLFTKERTKFASLGKERAGIEGVVGAGKKVVTAFKEGTQASKLPTKFGQYSEGLKNVFSNAKNAGKEMRMLDFKRSTFPDTHLGNMMEAYTNTIFGLLSVEDRIPFEYTRNRSLYEQGLAYLKNNGIDVTGVEKTKWLQEFVKDPMAKVGEQKGGEVVALANQDALVGVFQNDTILNNVIQQVKSNPKLSGIPEIIIPFSKTPAAFANQIIAYSPVGIMRSIFNAAREGTFNQKKFSEGIARGLVGTSAVALGVELYKKGLISGNYPTDPKEQAEWQAKRKLPNAIKINGKWWPITTFGPTGHLLVVGAEFQKTVDETGSVSQGLTQGSIAGLKSVEESTFLKGLNAALNAATDPKRYASKFGQNLAGSIVPTIVSDVAKATDKYQRDVNDIWDAIQTRIPGIREAFVQKRLDVTGQPIPIERGPFGQILNLRQSKERETPITAAMDVMKSKGYDVYPSDLSQTVNGIKLNNDEYYTYKRVYGSILNEALNAMITSSAYQNSTDAQKEKLWASTYLGAKTAVREQIAPMLMVKRYGLPETTNINQLNEVVKVLSKEEKFKAMSTEKQGQVIKKLLGM